MFRIAPVVLLAASLCSVATAQAADLAVQKKNPIKQAPLDNGTVSNEPSSTVKEPIADGTVVVEPGDVEPKPIGTASLKLGTNGPLVEAWVYSSEPGFVGVVGLSLTKNLTYSFGLPPLLTDAVVMAFGATDTQYLGLGAPLSSLPMESITLFGQALVIDEKGLWSSKIVTLAIGGQPNGTEPAKDSPSKADLATTPAIH